MGDSPELMPLDSHIFADFKRDLKRYSAFYPDLFDLGTPDNLWRSMCRIWRSGCSPLPERVTQDVMNWRRNVQWIIKAEGHVVPELNVRNGRRKAVTRRTRRRRLGVARLQRSATARQKR